MSDERLEAMSKLAELVRQPGHEPNNITYRGDEARGLVLDLRDARARLAAQTPIIEAVTAWRMLRMEYDALSASVQQRFADLGRPPGFSAWNDDEKARHNRLLSEMFIALNNVQAAIDALPAAHRPDGGTT